MTDSVLPATKVFELQTLETDQCKNRGKNTWCYGNFVCQCCNPATFRFQFAEKKLVMKEDGADLYDYGYGYFRPYKESEDKENEILYMAKSPSYSMGFLGCSRFGFYRDTGHYNDHCYKTFYDPRHLISLRDKGKIELENVPCRGIKIEGCKAF